MLVPVPLVLVQVAQKGLSSYILLFGVLDMSVLEHIWAVGLVRVWVYVQHELVACYPIGISTQAIHDGEVVRILLQVVFHLYSLLLRINS